MKLTENQIRGARAKLGNILLNSGAGSGKSSVIIARIANLIANEKVAPSNILGLTFTNEAANNMKLKLSNKVGQFKSSQVNLSTFHSFAYRTLKSEYPKEYEGRKIMESWWKLKTIYDIIGKPTAKNPSGLGLDIKGGDMIGFISYQKSNMVRQGDEVLVDSNVEYVGHINENQLQKAYDTYCERVKHARTIDFDDMLMDFYYKLLYDNTLLNKIKRQYEYILVDEFQDTSTINLAILQLISQDNLFVVGDFRQGIYGFINANIDNILEFNKTFNDVEIIELPHNFRSTQRIIDICNDVIESSPNEKYKDFSEQISGTLVEGAPVEVRAYADELVEAESIVDTIQERVGEGLEYDDFAILCRTNAQLGVYESVLAGRNIPARLSGERSFFDRKEVADILAYATHALYSNDDMSIRRIFNAPVRYIANTTLSDLDKFAFEQDISVEEAIKTFDGGRYQTGLNKVLSDFRSIRKIIRLKPDIALRKIYEITNYEHYMVEKAMSHTEIILRQEAMERLFDMAGKFTTVGTFLAHVDVIKNNAKKPENAVNVMTVHASKGLEFKHVFVTGVNEDNYPHEMSTDYEEERRLLYVALSRAIEKLEISVPIFSGLKGVTSEPSPFLMDIMEDDMLNAKRKIIGGGNVGYFEYKHKEKGL